MRIKQNASAYALFALSILSLSARAQGRDADARFYEQRVRPLLVQRCYACHSAKAAPLQGGLLLDSRAGWLKGGATGPALVPGSPDTSTIVRAVRYADPTLQMPPTGKLSAAEIAVLAEWVKRGAPGPAGGKDTGALHWAFAPIRHPLPPAVKGDTWSRTPIDRFILAKLRAQRMTPNPAADRRTLIRRVYYDLVGLPPAPAEVDAFLHDAHPDAYERVVDRLLASQRYGERWGRHWLDVAHYADTHGYDKDKRRDNAWPYRDYVIRAFNTDKPYGQFVREQIAGDVLHPGDPEGIVATGFVAAGPWDLVGEEELREGTVEKEKTRLLDRDDMVATTIGTFCSVTIHCARCHDHKFDPIPQRDYYRLQAVFSGVERGDRTYELPADAAVRADLTLRRTTLLSKVGTLKQQAAAISSPELAGVREHIAAMRAELAALPLPSSTDPSPSNGYHSAISDTQDVTKWVQIDLGQAYPIDTIRLFPARPTDFADTPGFGFPVRFRIAVSDDPTFAASTVVDDHTSADYPNPGATPYVVRAGKTGRFVRVTATRLWKRTGDYVFALGELQAISNERNMASGAAVTALDSIEQDRWSRAFLVDGYDSRGRLPKFDDAKVVAALVRGSLLQFTLSAALAAENKLHDSLIPPDLRDELVRSSEEMAAVDKQIAALPPRPMTYALLPHAPRPIHILNRGEVEQPTELVGAGALSCLPGLPSVFTLAHPNDEGERRAALARWITDPKNMLTWRSIVNRVWHYHFGRGIVDTPNDFGRNGSAPSHPELLDWLASHFLADGQSIKRLNRMICLSAAYRQSSASNTRLEKLDGDNRLLWRMNRGRLDAEEVRDSILAVSGKLDLKMGGPGFELFKYKDDYSPVYDYTDIASADSPSGWRRTVYCFTVRSVENPFLECLDCADPNVNTPVRNTTLTALQALALLNDPFVLQQSEFFAERVRATNPGVEQQVTDAYRLAFCRPPTIAERADLTAYARKYGMAAACRLLYNADEFVFVD